MKEKKEAVTSCFYCRLFYYMCTTGILIAVLFLAVLLDISAFD